MRGKLMAGAAAFLFALSANPAWAVEQSRPAAQDWSFSGVFGVFDRAAQQRGFQVYQQVCAACHSLKLVHYRDLAALGYADDEVKAFAAGKEVQDGPNDAGEMFTRPALPSDHFVSPFANAQVARAANNGALPPDLSLITKARKGGADYLYALLVGYADPPEGMELMEGMSYNPYFAGRQIAMPPPLAEGAVEFADGTPATVEQMAADVTTFLAWASEPDLEERKRLGIKVILFLLVLTGLLYASKRKVWSDLH
ncbi:MAG: cytochrome c1 [Proteobacteria bacterium]|nr:cytochrome c1 [Pseudomonadota bacterium]